METIKIICVFEKSSLGIDLCVEYYEQYEKEVGVTYVNGNNYVFGVTKYKNLEEVKEEIAKDARFKAITAMKFIQDTPDEILFNSFKHLMGFLRFIN